MPNIGGYGVRPEPQPRKDKIKLKIVSDGTTFGTHVVDRETGERLEDVVAIEWRISVGGLSEVIFTMRSILVELTNLAGQVSANKMLHKDRTHKRRIELEK